ncbi:hypothetical protein [Dyadobacter sp. LHD-138]|uniref:hypothetical protein n=1 Tax=Dyadobacter sp. LHD-138 TaxID=3071413 RepID=UPI0027E1D1CB|nr:hypothetical protein [Dyadobacter sp. LHD-138]MDQ6482585.1 hypothetical protein [Dyadobacter sp. LHD-138]
MKKFVVATILSFLTFSGSIAFAQPETLKGTWISAEQDLIEILYTGRDSNFNYLSNKLLNEDRFHLFIFSDTLSFQHIYTSSFTQFKTEYTDRYDLKVVSVNDSILVVRPVSDFSKTYFQNRSVITLKKKKYISDKTIVFEKLIYHSKMSGPTAALQIDSSKNLYMNYVNTCWGGKNGLASGNYSAVLDDDTYKELIHQLQTCNLRTLRFGDIKGADSPVITLIVYFNGRRKYLKSIAPPRISDELVTFIIWRLRSYEKLKPTLDKKQIE